MEGMEDASLMGFLDEFWNAHVTGLGVIVLSNRFEDTGGY